MGEIGPKAEMPLQNIAGYEMVTRRSSASIPSPRARSERSVRSPERGSMHRLSGWFGNWHLDRALERQHLTGIAFSGTIGIGLFINSGEVISIGGPLGLVLGYLCASLIVVSVNRCLAELVSIRPLESALIDYPYNFVDESLGYACGITYCLAQCITMATLIAAAVQICTEFPGGANLSTGVKGGILTALWLAAIANNLVGVKSYGNLERVYKHIKILTILSLMILMICVNVGVGSKPGNSAIGTINYDKYALVPCFNPIGFSNNMTEQCDTDRAIPGAGGRFLAVWTAITLTLFGCMGGEIVVVAAGEAKYPRRDLPAAVRFMYLAPLSLYILSALLVGFNINYNDPHLFRPWIKPSYTAPVSYSPFIIVLKKTTLAPDVLPSIYGGLFLFSAYSAGNTALYAASRTLFGFVTVFGGPFAKNILGRTNKGNTPVAAILACALVGLLGYLELADDVYNQPIITMAAAYTGAMGCVLAAQCLAFIRFRRAINLMQEEGRIVIEDHKKKYYRAHGQPWWAWVGLIGSLLISLLSGWADIYVARMRGGSPTNGEIKSTKNIIWGLVGIYIGPLFFFVSWISYKLIKRTRLRTARDIQGVYEEPVTIFNDNDIPFRPQNGWEFWVKEVWSFVK